MNDRWMEGELMSGEERKKIKKDFFIARIPLEVFLLFFTLYYVLGLITAILGGDSIFVVNLIGIILFGGVAIAIGIFSFRRAKLIEEGKFLWTTGFIVNNNNEKLVDTYIFKKVSVDEFEANYYGFKMNYKVGDQVYLLDFLGELKFRTRMAAKMN